MSDRQIMLHCLSHLEAIHDRVEMIFAHLEPLLPYAARLGSGQMGMIDAMQARRDFRRSRTRIGG